MNGSVEVIKVKGWLLPGYLSIAAIVWQAAQAAPVVVWTALPTTKIFRDSTPPEKPMRGADISAARNEWVSFQVVLTPQADGRRIRVKVMDFLSLRNRRGQPFSAGLIPKEGAEVYLVGYVPIRERSAGGGEPRAWPDPLIPHTKPVDLSQTDGNQPFWITVKVPEDAVPGIYSGSVHILVDNRVVETVPVHLTVRTFALPKVFSVRTLFGLAANEVALGHQAPFGSEAHLRLMEGYFYHMLQRRLTPSGLPVALDSTEATRYLKEPALQQLYLPFNIAEVSREPAATVLAQLKENENLAARVTFFVTDPPKPEEMEILKLAIDHLKEKLPGVKLMVAGAPLPGLQGRVDIWAPGLGAFNMKSVRQQQAAGQQMWWTVDRAAKPPFPNLLIDEDGVASRIIPWMMNYYGVDGLVCPSLSLNSRLNPATGDRDYQDVWTFPMMEGGNGSGFLIYPAVPSATNAKGFAANGPISSIRLELLREGLADYEYLRLLQRTMDSAARKLGQSEESYGQQRTRELCSLMLQDLARFNHDPEKLERVRARVAEEIETFVRKAPPLLVRTVPPDFSSTSFSGAGIIIEGITAPGAIVEVAGQAVSVDHLGRFKAKVYPAVGLNRIIIRSSLGSKTASVTRTVTVIKDPVLIRAEEKVIASLPKDSGDRKRALTMLLNLQRKYRQGKYTYADRQAIERLMTFGAAASRTAPPPEPAMQPPLKRSTPKAALPPGTKNPVYVALAHLIARLDERQEGAIASVAEKALNQVNPDIDPKQEPCKVEPVKFLNKWGFHLSNGLIEVVVWRQGARIIQFRAGEVPLLHQPHPGAVADDAQPTRWFDLGGYEDAGKALELESLESWNMVVTRQSPAEVTLEARKVVREGKVKLRRRMTVRQGDTTLYVDYALTNLTNEEVLFPWRAHVDPGIGFADQEGRGNPWSDRLIIPATEPVKHDSFDAQLKQSDVSTQLLTLKEPWVASYDSVAKAALVITLPNEIQQVSTSRDTRNGVYTLEPGNAFDGDSGFNIPAGAERQFRLQLTGLFGVSTPEEIIHRFGRKN